nr:hypothetical protein LTR18_002961 [Exophiala xenobiotica]
MSPPTKDESTFPMLGSHRSEGEYDDVDIEEQHASDLLSNKTSSTTTVYEKSALALASRNRDRQDSYSSSWSSADTITTPSSRKSRRSFAPFLTWIRWGVAVGLQSIIIFLLLCQRKDTDSLLDGKGKVVETGGDINGLYKTLSHTYTYLKPDTETFIPNMTTNENRLEIRRNWDLLMPLGSGSVAIPDYRDHPLLGDPITDDPIRNGPLFEASWTHALHCLYYSVDSYHQLIVNGRTDNDNPHHAGHCFEYLRNSILCNLDMTLEGSMSTPDDHERGQPHVCRNRAEAIAWIEARRVDDLQDIVGP